MDHKHRTIVQNVQDDLMDKHGISIDIQRDDLLHPFVSGNKWRKLFFFLEKFPSLKKQGIVSFGGVFSNHLAATAFACYEHEIPFACMIRGEEDYNNPTIQFLQKYGTDIQFVSRSDFRAFRAKNWQIDLPAKWRHYYILPEGGHSQEALKGCALTSKSWKKNYDYFVSSIGTGTTFSGIMNGLEESTKGVGMVMLKDKNYLDKEIEKMVSTPFDYELIRDYHFGGFGKVKPELIHFINDFYQKHKIPLDPVYTGKMLFGIYDMVKKGYFPRGSRIVAIHTGGIQGVNGYNYQQLQKENPHFIDIE